MKHRQKLLALATLLAAALTTHAQTLTEVMVLDRAYAQDVLVSPFTSGKLLLTARTSTDAWGQAVLAADLTTAPPLVTPLDSNLTGWTGYARRLGFASSFGALGALFSVGNANTANGIAWHVRRSLDQGTSWAAVEPGWQSALGQQANTTGFAADGAGNCFVSGWAFDRASTKSNYKPYWIVRRSADQASSWTTTLKSGVGIQDAAFAIHFVPVPADQRHLGGVFAVGRIGSSWTVMRTRNGGNSWTTVDALSSRGGDAVATAITSDSQGNLYVGGTTTTSKQSNWLVKRSTNGGDTWASLGSPLSTAGDNRISALAVDGANTLWVVGAQAWNSPSQAWVMQRWNPATGGWNGTPYYPYGSPGTQPVSAAMGASADPISGKVYVTGDQRWNGNNVPGESSLTVFEISN